MVGPGLAVPPPVTSPGQSPARAGNQNERTVAYIDGTQTTYERLGQNDDSGVSREAAVLYATVDACRVPGSNKPRPRVYLERLRYVAGLYDRRLHHALVFRLETVGAADRWEQIICFRTKHYKVYYSILIVIYLLFTVSCMGMYICIQVFPDYPLALVRWLLYLSSLSDVLRQLRYDSLPAGDLPGVSQLFPLPPQHHQHHSILE